MFDWFYSWMMCPNYKPYMFFSIWQCDPYFDSTGCSHPGCEPAYPTPKCVRKCVNKNQLWRNSKHYSVSAYRINSDPENIMAEIYKNGPVEVSFTVYEVKQTHTLYSYYWLFCIFLDMNLNYRLASVGLSFHLSLILYHTRSSIITTCYNIFCLTKLSVIRKHIVFYFHGFLTVLQDFAHYKSGVYKHITGDVMGGHAVKLIGWGTSDDGEDYWVCWQFLYLNNFYIYDHISYWDHVPSLCYRFLLISGIEDGVTYVFSKIISTLNA